MAARLLEIRGLDGPSPVCRVRQSRVQFVCNVVEPSAKMLDICRQRADELGLGSRCVFHEGYLDTLADDGAYDAATALLVSHYLGERVARQEFFRSTSRRLRAGGIFVNADLAADVASAEFGGLFEAWKSMLSFSGMSPEEIERSSSSFRKGATAIPTHDIEDLLTSSGFRQPVLFCQTLLIHAWYSTR
jgi:tRNA (cmo5U34)-methyltransferase